MILHRLLAGAFGAAVALRNSMYDRGTFRVNKLQGPVVSIGNINVGGTGKTPFTIALGQLLKQRGIAFDILSRGYGRQTTGARIVDPAGSALDFGDEPLLMARELGVNVVVGESRYAAGQLAEQTWGPRLHLLDDGFQHRALARQFDIVLLADEDLTSALLPAGRLREPLSSLSRADAIVTTGNPAVPAGPQHWKVRREINLDSLGALSPPPGEGGVFKCVAFCGIAKPQNFFRQLREQGVGLAGEIAFRDHHRYTESDIHHLVRAARENSPEAFITTAKDAINLEALVGHSPLINLGGIPVHVAKLNVTISDPDAVLDHILATLRSRGKTV